MVVLDAFVALAAGFIVLTLLSLALSTLVTRMVPSWSNAKGPVECGPGYALVSLGSAFLGSAAGGYVTAWVAAANPLVHVMALGPRQGAPLVPARAGGHPAPRRAGWRIGAAQGAGDFVEDRLPAGLDGDPAATETSPRKRNRSMSGRITPPETAPSICKIPSLKSCDRNHPLHSLLVVRFD